MADTTLLLNGFSIIGYPQTNANNSDGGEFMIHDGTALFEDDDVVVFQVANATEDGVLTDDSVITGIIVYDNASDYFNYVAKYTYDAPPGGGGEIDVGRKTMGGQVSGIRCVLPDFDGCGCADPRRGRGGFRGRYSWRTGIDKRSFRGADKRKHRH